MSWIKDREEFKQALNLLEVKGTYGEKWLIERNHLPDEKFLWDPKRRNIYLLNLSGDETKILGLQIRPIVKKNSGSKYYTYKLSGIYKNLLKEIMDIMMIGMRKVSHLKDKVKDIMMQVMN